MAFTPEHIIQSGGLLLLAVIIFAESGLLVGFFLPGDSLLFTAGFFASQGQLPLGWLLVVTVVSAIAGDNVGYTFGRRTGKRIFRKKDGILFRAEYIDRAEKFYEKHGGKTITIARFVPIVRTFAPIVAGVGHMERRKFMLYNVFGAVIWGGGVTLLGYWLGSKIPNVEKYLMPVILGAMLLSFGPALYHIFKDAETRRRIWAKLTGKRVSSTSDNSDI